MHILSICSRRTFEKTSMLKVSLYLPPSPPLSHTLSLSLSHIASFFETPQLLPRLPPDHFPLMLSFLLWRPCQSARWASRSAACWMREVQTCSFSEARARLRFGTISVLIPETRHMHACIYACTHTHTRFRQSLRFCKRRIKQLAVGVCALRYLARAYLDGLGIGASPSLQPIDFLRYLVKVGIF